MKTKHQTTKQKLLYNWALVSKSCNAKTVSFCGPLAIAMDGTSE